MAAPKLLTYFDTIEHLQNWLTGRGSANQAMIRQAVNEAYEAIAHAHDWSFLMREGRVLLREAETSGTVVFDFTGGTYERQLTLSGAGLTWPSWAEDACVKFDDQVSHIESRKSGTVVTLDAVMNPLQDVASTSLTAVYPKWYALPSDFLCMTGPLGKAAWQELTPSSYKRMLALDKYSSATGDPRAYCIQEAPDLYGSMALFVNPPSDDTEPLDFVYKRRPRALRYSGHAPADYIGTLSLTSGSATATGSSTVWTSGMVDSILRVSSDANRPTDHEGLYPWVEQRSVAAVASATSLTMDANASAARSSVKYVITDPIDLGKVAHNAFLRMCESALANLVNSDDKTHIWGVAQQTLKQAKGADNRIRQRQVAGAPCVARGRLADTTWNSTVEE